MTLKHVSSYTLLLVNRNEVNRQL